MEVQADTMPSRVSLFYTLQSFPRHGFRPRPLPFLRPITPSAPSVLCISNVSAKKPSPDSDQKLRKKLEYSAEGAKYVREVVRRKNEIQRLRGKRDVILPKREEQFLNMDTRRLEELGDKMEKALRNVDRGDDLQKGLEEMDLIGMEIWSELGKNPGIRSILRRATLKRAAIMVVIFYLVYVSARGACRWMWTPKREPLTPESAARGEA